MKLLKPVLFCAGVLLGGTAGAVSYQIDKSTSVTDDQGGQLVTRSTGALGTGLSLLSATTSFEDFLFKEAPRVRLTGELQSSLSGERREFSYQLDGEVNVEVGPRTHNVRFDGLTISRRGVGYAIDGIVLVNGEEYTIPEGSLAEEIVVAIIILQGQ